MIEYEYDLSKERRIQISKPLEGKGIQMEILFYPHLEQIS